MANFDYLSNPFGEDSDDDVKPDSIKCYCGRDRDQCPNFQNYGYDCMGFRPNDSGSHYQAPWGYSTYNITQYPVGPIIYDDRENNEVKDIVLPPSLINFDKEEVTPQLLAYEDRKMTGLPRKSYRTRDVYRKRKRNNK
jgi:hypothetical protein